MRTLGATAVLSLVVHGAALAWVLHDPKPEPLPVVAVTTPAPVEAELMFVDLVPDAAPVPAHGRGDDTTVAPAGTPRRTAITAATGPTRPTRTEVVPAQPEHPPEPIPGKPPVVRHLMMRGPEVTPVGEQLASLALSRPDATQLPDYPGLRTGAALDAARHRLRGGDPEALGEIVALEDEQHEQELKLQKDGTHRTDKTTFVAEVAKDGTVKLTDKANLRRNGLGATFDTTDWLMRRQGMDPYASAKREYLDRTRDQRVEIGKAYRKEQLAQSAKLMATNLDRLWASVPDVSARKQAVFELWEECAETGDAAIVEGGAKARTLLERFVQVKLRGADGFTAEELARLNAHRRSRAAFDPYH